jgi:integrase
MGHKSNLRPRGAKGTLYARIYVGSERIERSTGTPDMEEARRIVEQWEREAEDQGDHPEGPTTIEQALDALLEDRRAKVRSGEQAEATIRFYEQHAGLLLGVFDRTTPVAQWETNSEASWSYIDTRRADQAKDRIIRKELGTLRMALKLASERGRFRGNPDLACPSSFRPGYTPRRRSLTREQVTKLLPELNPNAAAVVTYILATSGEMAAVERALGTDIPDLEGSNLFIAVRGTKNDNRNRIVPVVLDEQKLLLSFTKKHAGRAGSALFGGLDNLRRDLREACKRAQIPHCSPHDLRHTAGQWFIDLGVPVEIVSRMLGHSSTGVTERVYARVRQEALGDRIRAALPESLWSREASRGLTKALKVTPLTTLLEPRWQVYEIDGARKTLSEWAEARGIPKGTLHYRLKTMGLPIEQALEMRRWGKPTTEVGPADLIAGVELAPNLPQTVEPATRELERRGVEGSTDAPDAVDAAGRSGRAAGQGKTRSARNSGASPGKVAPAAGLEPATRRLTAACSTD